MSSWKVIESAAYGFLFASCGTSKKERAMLCERLYNVQCKLSQK